MTRREDYNRTGMDYMNETLTLIVSRGQGTLSVLATIQERGEPRCLDRTRDTAVTHVSVSNPVCGPIHL